MDRHSIDALGLDLVRTTEHTALKVGRWLGLGDKKQTHLTACNAMIEALARINMDGRIVIGEEGRLGGESALDSGQAVGTGHGPAVDVIIDPIDGTASVVEGRSGAISVVAVAPRGSMWAPGPDPVYMDKIVVDREAADSLVPECMDAPVAWTLALVARAKKKPVKDLQVIVLNKPRHEELIEEVRSAGARVLLRGDGDTVGAMIAATPNVGADVLIGIGGVPEGVTAACAVKAMGGAMLGRLAPQSAEEWQAIKESGLDVNKILTCDEIVTSREIYLAATGITPGPLLPGVTYRGKEAQTYSLLMRAETRTRRYIRAEHAISQKELDEKTRPW